MGVQYHVGDKIHILPYEQMGLPSHVNSEGAMKPWYDTVATVSQVLGYDEVHIFEDDGEWYWHYKNIEPALSSVDINEKDLMGWL